MDYKYKEDQIIERIKDYIDNTYTQHYVGDNKQVQTIDVWDTLGIAKPTCQATAIKYLMRYGKKKGFNREDLLKAVHYIILLWYFSDKEEIVVNVGTHAKIIKN